jgi:cytochrome b pre-mRNA-processing protein 3
VAQARHRAFYTDYRVPDTAEGRLDMIMLLLLLLLHRVDQEEEALRALGQAVFDRFCQDMDDNLREMGVGDLSVPRQMQRIGAAFYGRAKAYRAALAAADPADLVAALRRNIYRDEPATETPARRLAAYVRNAAAQLGGQDGGALAAGRLIYPEPAAATATAAPS